jgi:FkbM family methyltransferase
MGILKYSNTHISGEDFVIKNVLKKYLKTPYPVLFDIGANIGTYSQKLKATFPFAKVYAIEPNQNTFNILKKNLQNTDIGYFNLGLSSSSKKERIYTYKEKITSEHASFYKNVFLDVHLNSDIVDFEVETVTLDDFCTQYNIPLIDFLKIDTEGHEYEVLKGGVYIMKENRVKIIQFEFNEMNIISRVFLKDFYEALQNYKLFRIDTNRLIPIFNYDAGNEIFKYQNILAINNLLYDQQ